MHFRILFSVIGLALADKRSLRSNQLETEVSRKRPSRSDPWIIVDPSDVASSNDGATARAEESSMWRFLFQDERMSLSMNHHDQLSPTSRPSFDAPRPSVPPPPSTPPPTVCPSVDEPCMNDENFQICTDLIDNGCQDLVILESCPLQFQCGDENSEYPSCGGIAGIPCEEGLFCYTGNSNDCDEDCGAADCPGECRKVVEGEQCLGFAGFQCPNGSECVDDKGDDCSPNCGGADCIGICLVV